MQRHSPAPPAVRAELERVLASETFQNAERLRRFLRFVVDESLRDPGATLKEHWLAIHVFDRPESFDPRSDSVVRIAARQVRFKLRDYYETEGREDTVRMNLPKGSYRTGELITYLATKKIRVSGKLIRRFCSRHGIARDTRPGRPRARA